MQTLTAKVKGRQVQIEVKDIDRYNRAVSVVRIGTRDVNEEMVREGYAWAYRRYLERPYASRYIGAEEEARRRRHGGGGTEEEARALEGRESDAAYAARSSMTSCKACGTLLADPPHFPVECRLCFSP